MHTQSTNLCRCLAIVSCLTLLLGACAQTGNEATPTITEPLVISTDTPTGEQPPTPQLTATPHPTMGVNIELLQVCTDGVGTYILIRTDLDMVFWGLSDHDLQIGGAFFETSLGFYENDRIFSSTSSGARYEMEIDLDRQIASTEQSFTFPQGASLNGQYSITAFVNLLDFPPNYQPPIDIQEMGQGVMIVPMEFKFPVMMQNCP